jgi:hypothetical protein
VFSGTIGLRSDFVNIDHTTPYASVNLGASREFQVAPGDKPFTVRSDIVNVFDQIYELRPTAPASACLRRNSARAAAIISAFRRNSDALRVLECSQTR